MKEIIDAHIAAHPEDFVGPTIKDYNGPGSTEELIKNLEQEFTLSEQKSIPTGEISDK